MTCVTCSISNSWCCIPIVSDNNVRQLLYSRYTCTACMSSQTMLCTANICTQNLYRPRRLVWPVHCRQVISDSWYTVDVCAVQHIFIYKYQVSDQKSKAVIAQRLERMLIFAMSVVFCARWGVESHQWPVVYRWRACSWCHRFWGQNRWHHEYLPSISSWMT
jgi:hypothetical protein